MAAAAAATVAAGLVSACSSDDGIVVNLYGGMGDGGFDKLIADCNKQAAGKYTIVGNLTPADADSQREQYVRRLAAKDKGMDLLGLDVTWTAEFAEAGWIRELTGPQATEATKDTLQPPIDSATWKDKLYGIPKHTNVQLLWYRKSLVPKVPKTWDEMLTMAADLEKAGKPHQIGLTAAKYEGYVVAFNALLNSYGGTVINADSTEATVDDNAVKALELLKRFATSSAASKSLSNSQETEVFAQLEAGESAFSINWPYVLASMKTAGEKKPATKAVADDLAFAPYPEVIPGKEASVTLGGMNFAISKYSEHPDEAYQAALCLRSPESQLKLSQTGGAVPVNTKVYADPAFQKEYPMYKILLEQLKIAKTRPKTPFYQNISTIISTALSPPSAIQPQATADKLRKDIQDTLEGKGILP